MHEAGNIRHTVDSGDVCELKSVEVCQGVRCLFMENMLTTLEEG